ncbi:MAG: hypothetical protein AAFR00_05215 [Pseudomonadota bacterium]
MAIRLPSLRRRRSKATALPVSDGATLAPTTAEVSRTKTLARQRFERADAALGEERLIGAAPTAVAAHDPMSA